MPSKGIESGDIWISEDQFKLYTPMIGSLHPEKEWQAVTTPSGTKMYKWRDAPYIPRTFDLDATTAEYFELTQRFIDHFKEAEDEDLTYGWNFYMDGDEDEDFTYGCMCSALNPPLFMRWTPADWLLSKIFGNLYGVKYLSYRSFQRG